MIWLRDVVSSLAPHLALVVASRVRISASHKILYSTYCTVKKTWDREWILLEPP